MSPLPVRPGRARAGAAVLIASALALILSSCGSTSVASVVRVNAVTVDGASISRKSFEHDISALSANKQLKQLDVTQAQQAAQQGSAASRLFDSAGKPTRVLTTSWLNRVLNQIVIDREFKAKHLVITADDKSEGAAQFAQLFARQNADGTTTDGTAVVKAFPKWFQTQEDARTARLVALTRALDAKHTVTQKQMQDYYNQNVGNLCQSGFEVAHILSTTQAAAQAIATQLAQGANFAALAKQKSTDTQTGAAGGDIGGLGSFQAPTAFETAAENATVNVPTAPVQSELGWSIILKTKYVPPSFDSVEAQIRQALLGQLNLAQKLVSADLKKASVRVASVYGTWNPKTSVVDAPKVPSVRSTRHPATTTTTASSTPPTT
jgi:parvulin-like peptidyl-prolyl isomerase